MFGGILLTVLGLVGVAGPSVTEKAEGWIALYDEHFVDELQFPPNAALVVWGGLAGVGLVVLAIPFMFSTGQAIFLYLIIGVVAGFGPKMLYIFLRQSRRKKIEAVLPNLLQQLAANFKTTSDVSRALFEVSETAPAPMDHELRLIRQKENDLGSFPEALDQASQRIGSDWFDVVAGVLKTTYEHGGKESDALMNLSRVFVQLAKMQERIDTATSQGRMSMKIIMFAPFVVIAIAIFVVPDIAMDAWESTVGKVMLGMAAFVYIIAVLSAVWLSSVKI